MDQILKYFIPFNNLVQFLSINISTYCYLYFIWVRKSKKRSRLILKPLKGYIFKRNSPNCGDLAQTHLNVRSAQCWSTLRCFTLLSQLSTAFNIFRAHHLIKSSRKVILTLISAFELRPYIAIHKTPHSCDLGS